MARLEEKVAALRVVASTVMTADQIVAAADDAADQAAGVLDTVSRTERTDQRLLYTIKRAGMASLGTFTVNITGERGSHKVIVEADRYLTSRATVLFIPIGPRPSTFLTPFRRFTQLFRDSLKATTP